MNVYARLVYRNLRANLDKLSLFFELFFPLFFVFVQGSGLGGINPATRYREWEDSALPTLPRRRGRHTDGYQRRHKCGDPALVRPKERDVRADSHGAIHEGPVYPEHYPRNSDNWDWRVAPRLPPCLPPARGRAPYHPPGAAAGNPPPLLRETLLRWPRNPPLRGP